MKTSSNAQYEVMLFAIARELAGTERLRFELNCPATAGTILQTIGNVCPAIEPWLASCRLAVNQNFVAEQELVSSDAEIALIPPVSGG